VRFVARSGAELVTSASDLDRWTFRRAGLPFNGLLPSALVPKGSFMTFRVSERILRGNMESGRRAEWSGRG
jgi:hypothetical protein